MKHFAPLSLMVAFAFINGLTSKDINAQTFSSGQHKVQLVELYSSQGCSSCPPAQQWLNNYRKSPDLWKNVVPVVFHVDYWDYLGWKDPYSSSDYSSRQRQFKQQGLARSVYTPGFFVNGKEWTGFFNRRTLPDDHDSASELIVNIEEGKITASFQNASNNSLLLNVAVLGMDLSTYVKAGENHNRTLKENFIVLNHTVIESNNGEWESNIAIPSTSNNLALAAWVTPKGKLTPLQSTGGLIN
jgi:hypothetical protein